MRINYIIRSIYLIDFFKCKKLINKTRKIFCYFWRENKYLKINVLKISRYLWKQLRILAPKINNSKYFNPFERPKYQRAPKLEPLKIHWKQLKTTGRKEANTNFRIPKAHPSFKLPSNFLRTQNHPSNFSQSCIKKWKIAINASGFSKIFSTRH